MISTISNLSQKAKNTINVRRSLTVGAGLLALGALCVGTQANAGPVHFRSNGGRWSHSSHAGWNRYWGGPSVGFYYAPSPVYVVPGYASASYYSGSSFWYSNPSFGLSINLGGGNGGGYYRHSDGHFYSGGQYRGGNYSGGGRTLSGGHYYSGSTQRVQSVGGHTSSGGNSGGRSGRGSSDHHR